MLAPKIIYSYIVKNFLIKFINVSVAIAILIFIINLLNVFDAFAKYRSSSDGISHIIPFTMAALQIPSFLEDISVFLVMLAAMLTLFNLSMKSEITIMRSSGLSLWHILSPLLITSFILGLVFIFIFNPAIVAANKKFYKMENKFINKKSQNILSPDNGIWLKQQNILKNDEVIIIRAEKIYKDNLNLVDVNLWFFNKNNKFYKKIDAKNMFLKDYYWQLEELVINDKNNINKNFQKFKILTDLESEFILKKIINNFENPKSFSTFELPFLIQDLKRSGFPSRSFQVYYYFLLTKPFMFSAIILISALFAINNFRNKSNILYMIAGVVTGLILYITSTIISAFGSSGLIPEFAATWVVTIIIITTAILLTFSKDKV